MLTKERMIEMAIECGVEVSEGSGIIIGGLCEYCEVDVDDRKNIFIIETDYVDYEIYVDGNNNLSSDFPFGKKINYCPMCGRKLWVNMNL